MNKEIKEESVESKINKFIKETFNKTKEELSMMTLPKKMEWVSMRNLKKWEEFKLGLRKAGYII